MVAIARIQKSRWERNASLLNGVILWECPIKSGGAFFSNINELFRKPFDCPTNLWEISR